MQWFGDLRTAAKLVLCLGVLALLMAVAGYLGIRGMAGIQAVLIDMHDHHTLGLLHLKQANVNLLMTARERRSMLLAGDASRAETHWPMLNAIQDQVIELAMNNQHQQAVTRLAVLSTNLAKVDHYTTGLTKRKLATMRNSLDTAQANYSDTREPALLTLAHQVGVSNKEDFEEF